MTVARQYFATLNLVMWRVFFILAVAALASSLAPGGRGEGEGVGSSESKRFYPLEQGVIWVYDTLRKDTGAHFDMRVTTEGPWTEDGLSGTILTQRDKRGKMRQFMIRNEKGVFVYKLGLSKAFTPEVFTRFRPPVPCLIFLLVPGHREHWEGRLKVAWVDKPIVFDGEVIGWEDVTVPAGQFHCIKFHYREKRGNELVEETAWYAEGVGQVKYDGGQYVKELKSFQSSGGRVK